MQLNYTHCDRTLFSVIVFAALFSIVIVSTNIKGLQEPSSHTRAVLATSKENLIRCFDRMHQRKQNDLRNNRPVSEAQQSEKSKRNNLTIPSDSLYFVFIGDSRVRQIFLLFLELLPQFDILSEPVYEKTFRRIIAHEDVFVYSEVFRVAATYHWSGVDNTVHNLEGLITHLINSTFFPGENYALVNRSALNLRPDSILIGISTHYMLPRYKAREEEYSKRLGTLNPLIEKLSKETNVFWLDQYPVVEQYAANDAINAQIDSYKIWRYNEIAHRILKGVQLWGEGTPWVVEYIRSCLVSKRRDAWPNGHFICSDFIHPGTSALSEIARLYVTKVCSSD